MSRTLSTRAAQWLLLAAAAYAAVLLARYFFPPHIPRYKVESAFIIFVAAGMLCAACRPGGAQPLAWAGPLTRASVALVALSFIAGAFVLYAPALRLGFLSDDFVIAEWARRHELLHYAETGFVRPAIPLLWAALEVLPGDLAAAVHAANIVFHAANGVLVVLVACRLGLRTDEAIAAGTLFLAFPALSEAIVWASGAQDVVMTTFCLAAVILATSEGRPRLGAALAASMCALMVKETAVIIPALAALVLWGRGGRLTAGGERRVVAALLLLSAAYVAARIALGLPPAFFGVDDGRYFAKRLVAGVFAALGAPWTDAWGRAHSTRAFVRAALILALLAAALHAWRRHDTSARQSVACAAWVLAGVLPVFSFFYIGSHLEGARYVYLSAAGFAMLLALLAARAAEYAPISMRRGALVGLTAALAVPLLPAMASDITRWQAAAGVRDQLLAHARAQLGRSPCAAFSAGGLADSIDGAFVFRHGLAQALGLPEGGAGTTRCHVTWTGSDLIVLPEEP